jgi:co-chaperonin GroES (HSP10)
MNQTEPVKTFGSEMGDKIPDLVFKDRPHVPVITQASREEQAKSQIDKLPAPTGYRILIVPYSQPSITRGGIQLAESTLKTEEIATTIGYVVSLGPDAYKDPEKYPEGPWCSKGDYVMFGRYAGARIVMAGENKDDLPLRLLNDDEILATIKNPEDFVGVK